MKKVTCCAFLPFYDEAGKNATYYILRDGSKEIHDFPVKHFITELLHTLWVDPLMLKRWSQNTLRMKSHLPLILSPAITFIPIKIRSNVPSHDGCLGYVLTSAIESYTDFEIILNNGVILETLSCSTYISRKLREAKFLSLCYEQQKSPIDLFVYTP